METQVNKTDLKKMMSLMRQDIRKGFCSLQDACYILDVKRDTFYALVKDPNTKIRKAAIQGKYLLTSIDAEVIRLTL